MPSRDDLARARIYIERAEGLQRHATSTALVAIGLGLASYFGGHSAWPMMCVAGVAFIATFAAHLYLRAAAGLRSRR